MHMVDWVSLYIQWSAAAWSLKNSFLWFWKNHLVQIRKRRSGPVRSGSVRRSGLFWVDRIGPVFGKIDRTEPDRHVSEKYEFFQQFSGYFRSKIKILFFETFTYCSFWDFPSCWHIVHVMRPFKLYMNLTFNLTVDLTQSSRSPSSALHLYTA